MDTRLHPRLSTGLAVLGIGTAVIIAPLASAMPNPIEPNPIEPKPAVPAARVLPVARGGLVGQEIAFNVAFITDFLGTGAQLFARELPIPLTLAGAIANGTPVPIAVDRALHDFVAVELDAGRALVGFGAEYVRFQAHLVTGSLPRRPRGVTAMNPSSRRQGTQGSGAESAATNGVRFPRHRVGLDSVSAASAAPGKPGAETNTQGARGEGNEPGGHTHRG